MLMLIVCQFSGALGDVELEGSISESLNVRLVSLTRSTKAGSYGFVIENLNKIKQANYNAYIFISDNFLSKAQ